MDAFKEPGITNGPYTHCMMVRSGIDVGVTVYKIISKGIAKFEDDKLHNDSGKPHIEVALIVGIFKQEPRKGIGVAWLTGQESTFKTVEPG